MTSTDDVELTSTINSGLPWKMVAKGSRSSTRRNKKPVARVAALDVQAVDRSAAGEGAEGVSESEKLGVAVLGQHFAEKVEHVPIKKRRFILPLPSSPSISSSSRHEGPEHRAQINHALHVSRLNPNLVDGRTSEDFGEKPDCNSHDFSGIEILADVACSCEISSDIPTARDHLFVKEPAQQQIPSTLSVHVEGDDRSLVGTVTVSQKDAVHESGDQAMEDKSETVTSSKKNPVDVLDPASGEMVYQNNIIVVSNESSTEKPKGNVDADENENLAPQNQTVGSEKSSADEQTEKSKNIECPKDDRLHWDLNLTMDAWCQPCDAGEGKVTESVSPVETEPINGCKDRVDSEISSDVHVSIPLPSGSKAETAVPNTKDSQSGYDDSQFEDGELREPYPCWEENEGDAAEVEQVDYGSEPEDERFYHLGEGNESKLDGVDKGIVAEKKFGPVNSESGDAQRIPGTNEGSSDIEKHVVVSLNDSYAKGPSPSSVFSSKSFKELPSHGTVQQRRSDSYDESNERDAGSDKFMGRDRSGIHTRGRSPGRGHFGGWDSKRRLSPSPIYKGSSFGFGRRPKSIVESRGLMNGFDQPASGPDGHIRRQFSSGAYRGRFRRFPDDGNRDFRGVDRGFPGDANEYPGRMHHRNNGGSRRERSNSPVFRRLHYPHQPYEKSRSRSRSRSPVSWNNRNRSPGLRADDRMERVRLPFQKRFPADQEVGFMSPPRNRMSPPPRNSRFFEGRNSDGGENHNNNFRIRKSPGRMLRPGQRFDSNGPSMRRVSSESHFRPTLRHRRFDGTGGGRRGCKYEGGEEEKGGNRYEMVNRPRRSDNNRSEDGDNIRRFRFNGEQQQSQVVTNNNNNSGS
ncbi:PREDICTED: serine/arginine repetitive matrix protein 2-like [Tarenaya hassleriana]|uniref:serine/arginine repetitive matrix protein 2-like n=1 Tax=Tarenaya hassleriana TaxID=28532 RepID=UPI00053C165B|nr:PREDICTED: serine/arginine repetitive matrix protein 2-like [Tarenaya hassleriana]XP_010521366.1 PREDICTED: serine/arginine repetitive matrix protein 2-like [Tarenaya hassleriana]